MDTKRIFLTGFMGSGKTTAGRILADRLNLPFHDLDEMIVEKAGMSIPDIFERQGEAAFRKLEAEIVNTCSTGKGVFGLGGGAILDPDNRDVLLNAGIVIYLKASPAVLAQRLVDQTEGRPLLAGVESLEDRIKSLLELRSASYEKAHWSVDTDDLTPGEVASFLQHRLGEAAGD